jgi:hypothetical protein
MSLLVLLEPLSRRQHVQEALIAQTILQRLTINQIDQSWYHHHDQIIIIINMIISYH